MNAPADDLALIAEAAVRAGALAAAMRQTGLSVSYKDGDSPVSDADLAADALIRQILSDARPDYGWLSEETVDTSERLSKKRVFVVDPIDGTRAFVRNRPWWSVSIAVVVGDRPLAGVVTAPDVGETYTATAGGGAFLNGRPIQVTRRERLEGCRMVGDPQFFAHPAWPAPWPSMQVESRNSTAYRICLVASGAFDATLTLAPKSDWDLAAADLIALEAGGFCGDHRGLGYAYGQAEPTQPSLVCAGPHLTPLILERVRHIALRS